MEEEKKIIINKNVIIIILISLLILTSTFSFIKIIQSNKIISEQKIEISKNKETINAQKKELNKKTETINKYKDYIKQNNIKSSTTISPHNPNSNFNDDMLVYVTTVKVNYHLPDCLYLMNTKITEVMTLKEARNSIYFPCSLCF